MLILAVSAALLFACGRTAYGSMAAGIAAASLCVFAPKIMSKGKLDKRRKLLLLQFRDALQSVSSSLSAGKSIENAFLQASEDLTILYCGQDEMIIREIRKINRHVEMNGTLSAALTDLADRAGIRDITNFADVFVICLKTGGNMVTVIKNTCGVIRQKIDTTEEINILAAEKLLSFRIMLLMPAVFAILMMTGSPDYMKLLYTPVGNIAVTIALAIITVAFLIGRKIAASDSGYVV